MLGRFVCLFVCLFVCFWQEGVGFGFFQDRVSLYSPGCPGTQSVDQAGLELRNLSASASQVCHHCPAQEEVFKAMKLHSNKKYKGLFSKEMKQS